MKGHRVCRLDGLERHEADECARNGGACGERVLDEGAFFRESTLDQDGKVTDLLRDFMGDDDKPGRNTEGNGGEKCRG